MEELYHYGVKGMKWGVRKAAEEGAERLLYGDQVSPQVKKARTATRISNATSQKMSALDKKTNSSGSSEIDQDRVARLRAAGAAAGAAARGEKKTEAKKSGGKKKGGGGKGKKQAAKDTSKDQKTKEQDRDIVIKSLEFLKMFNDSSFVDSNKFKLDKKALDYAQKNWGISMNDLVTLGRDGSARISPRASTLLKTAAKAKEKLRNRK